MHRQLSISWPATSNSEVSGCFQSSGQGSGCIVFQQQAVIRCVLDSDGFSDGLSRMRNSLFIQSSKAVLEGLSSRTTDRLFVFVFDVI